MSISYCIRSGSALSLSLSARRVPQFVICFTSVGNWLRFALPFEIILAHPLRLLIIVFPAVRVCHLPTSMAGRERVGGSGARDDEQALSNSNPVVECSSCFRQVQHVARPSLPALFPASFFCSLSALFLSLFAYAVALLISSPFTVVYAVVSACCFHVCFFARVSFPSSSLSLSPYCLPFA